ncbi:fimbrial protein [Escherichia coli]|nr:fimbrial protein [Salmonella enterica]ECW6809940.1 fimbrial protein [Salmonella enterica subsp. enterica serovar Enteritidis]EFB2638951.1 fimbrial protein [Escherichia coli]EFW2785204.1 fimbrial protein [Shigella sonnei]EFW2789438.1 fimbrial protein [Shigella sonnei]
MKKTTLFLFVACLLPSCVLAWNTPGEGFTGELKLGGPVTSTRNPWVWKAGEENKHLDVKQAAKSRSGQNIPVPLPALTVLLGKTTFSTPVGREGLSPRVNYGKGAEDVAIVWTEPGTAKVTLPVTGENNTRVGTFVFRMQAAGVLRYVQDGQPVYVGVYDNLKANSLPGENLAMKISDIPGVLQRMFRGEGPSWLQSMRVTATSGLSRFSDGSLRQVEGAYGAQIVAGVGELRLNGGIPARWQTSLPVSIEYQ